MEVRKRRIRARKLWIALLSAFIALLLLYWLVNLQIRPALRQIAQVRVNALTSDAMYSTVLDCLNGEKSWEPFVNIAAENGVVYYVELNDRELTRFAAECAQIAQQRLIEYGKQGISIPSGSVSGVSMFAGVGPEIKLTFKPETNTRAYFSSEFRSAGINQTLHRVELKLEAQIAVTLPGEPQIVECHVDVPVAEHIIVGQVPDTYADVGKNPSLLNLLPNA